MQAIGFLERSCSQMRKMRQPCFRSVLVTKRSLRRLAIIFFCQYDRLLPGIRECFGHPCQKQPSTKIIRLCLRKTKSGFPKMGRCRRQPVILFLRRSRARAISVSLLPRPRMRDMTSERFILVKTSGISVMIKFRQKGLRKTSKIDLNAMVCAPAA
jgi:hypothetical protein